MLRNGAVWRKLKQICCSVVSRRSEVTVSSGVSAQTLSNVFQVLIREALLFFYLLFTQIDQNMFAGSKRQNFGTNLEMWELGRVDESLTS